MVVITETGEQVAGSRMSAGGHSPLVNPHSLVLVSQGCWGPVSQIHISVIFAFIFVPRTIKSAGRLQQCPHSTRALAKLQGQMRFLRGTVIFIYLCLAVLGLGLCVQVSLAVVAGAHSLVAGHRR